MKSPILLVAIVCAILQTLAVSIAAAAPALRLSTISGPPMTDVTVSGSGFAANTLVDVYFDLTQTAFRLTSSTGAFAMTLRVPASATPGEHVLTVMPHSGTGAAAQRVFTVQTGWGHRRFGPSGQGWNRTENLLDAHSVRDMQLSWDLGGTAGSQLYVTPLVVGSRVYIVTGDRRLKAYSRLTRAKLFDVAANAERITQPVYGNGLIFVPSSGGLAAYNYTTGALVWKAVLPPGVGGPVVRDGIVYVVARGSADAGLFAFSVSCGTGGATCRPLWQWRGGAATGFTYPETSVAVTARFVFAIIDRTLYQFPRQCGAAVCNPSFSVANIDSTAPTVANGIVYVMRSDMTLLALPETCIGCSVLWTATLSERSFRDVAVVNGSIYITTPARLYAFTPGCGASTCTPAWSTSLRSNGYGVVAAGSLLYVLTTQQLLVYPAVCYTGCPPLWQSGHGGTYSNVNYASVAIADGAVYSASDDGMKVYAHPDSPLLLRATGPAPEAKAVRLDRLRPSAEFAAAEAAVERGLAGRN
jgi:outer membrane protein assembly factor BamB